MSGRSSRMNFPSRKPPPPSKSPRIPTPTPSNSAIITLQHPPTTPPPRPDCQSHQRWGIILAMKRIVALVLVCCCGILPCVFGQGLDDEYVQIFKLIQEADTLATQAPAQALAKYLDAQAALDRLHKGSPDWNTRIVSYRLTYLANKIAALSAAASTPAAAPASSSN